MPNHKIITKLTDEQEALIYKYREKWLFIHNLLELISPDKIIEVINAAYLNTGYPEP
ncbi:hypothetical protein RIVM261_002770 [Rivularia sp. IAM M-261]|nr:hypothetical protein RIVM261_002770 [Rivularia sp. IAM M-261]